MIDRLNEKGGVDQQELVKEITKLKQKSEFCLHNAEKRLENLPKIPATSSKTGGKRQPIKPSSNDKHSLPNLKLEIEKIRADSLKNEEKILGGSHRSNAEDSGLLLKSQLTPSHSSMNQYRKSNEKWVVPKADKAEEQKVALAKALIKEKEELSKGSGFRISSLRNSVVSVSSADGNTNPLYSPSCRHHATVDGVDDDHVLIDDHESPDHLVEEQAIMDLNSYRDTDGKDIRQSGVSLAEENQKGSDSSRFFREDLPSPKDRSSEKNEKSGSPQVSENGKDDLPLLKVDQSKDHGLPLIDEPSVYSPSTATLNMRADNINDKLPQNLQESKAPSWMELAEGSLKLTSNEGVITIENSNDKYSQNSQLVELQDVGSPKEGAKKLFGEVNKHAKEIQADVITSEVLNVLFDELMMDGLVLRELFKLQIELPRGIKTNIKAVKKYLARLCEFIGSSQLLTRTLRKGSPTAAKLPARPNTRRKT